MHPLAVALGLLLLAVALLDAFQTIILPRRPVRRFRLTRLFFLATWTPWTQAVRLLPAGRHREQAYSIYGPLSLLVLFATWSLTLLLGFALVYFGLHTPFSDSTGALPASAFAQFRSCLYVSGTTLFTLGLGDVLPHHGARPLMVAEAGVGLGFFALVIGYVPVLYAAFSHREVAVALLDARAGSPPTAAELLLRHAFDGGPEELRRLLESWEVWCAELLETHVSYPILCYYRSQHDNQSWLAALTAILDVCALLITTIDGPGARQAQLTFAIGRHALVDLGHVFRREAVEQRLREAAPTRLPDDEFARLCDLLKNAGVSLCADLAVRDRLIAARRLYEPHACALAEHLSLELPHWTPPAPRPGRVDPWTSVSTLRSPNALGDRLNRHVSAQSTAAQLEVGSHLG